MVTCPGSGSDGGGGDNGGDPVPTGSEYNIYPNAGLNFEDSQAACEAQGGYLIVPNTQAELDELMANPVVAGATTKDAFWIGIVEKNKVSIGVDGSDVVTNYGPNEPNDKTGAEDCVRLKSDGTMNDALCELTWAGPKKQNIKMGYICEMPTYDRKRRSATSVSQTNGVPQACQVEYRTRKGAVESIRMNCKQEQACLNNKRNNFRDWKYGQGRTQCRPEQKYTHSVCRQCCNGTDCFGTSDFSTFTRDDWRENLL